LPGQVKDIVDAVDELAAIRQQQILVEESEPLRTDQVCEVGLLSGPRVVVGEAVDPGDGLTLREQVLGQGRPDKALRLR